MLVRVPHLPLRYHQQGLLCKHKLVRNCVVQRRIVDRANFYSTWAARRKMANPAGPTPQSPKLVMALKRELESANKKELAAHLQSLCCSRCSLRLLRMKDPNYFSLPVETIRDVLSPNTPHDYHSGFCPLCFGVLDRIDHPDFLAELKSKMQMLDYDSRDYMLNISLPASTQLRSYQSWYYLRSQYPHLKELSAPLSDVIDVKEVVRWLAPRHIKELLDLDFNREALWEVTWTFTHKETEGEQDQLFTPQKQPTQKFYSGHPKRRKTASNASTRAFLQELSEEERAKLFENMGFPQSVTTPMQLNVAAKHQALLVAGRYVKLKRNVSQSPFIIGGKRLAEHSVEELIAGEVLPRFKSAAAKFSSSGREDVDVRMLGRGRPFMLEILDPHREKVSQEELDEVQRSINEKHGEMIRVADLQLVTKQQAVALKEGEEHKRKHYRCVIWFPSPITPDALAKLNDYKDLVIYQKTPVRVLHRRANKVREKIIHSMHAEYVNPHYAILDLVTSAGTYVKEFVHGDLGRTQPNIASLLGAGAADLLALDVTAVDLDFPPIRDPNFLPSEGAPSIMEDLPDPGVRQIDAGNVDE